MRIAVVDGQGGGVGRALVAELRARLGLGCCIVALGANATATSVMMKAGANEGATGENAIIFNSKQVDVITGPIGIVMANAMLGELTPAMAQAIAESPAPKVLIPIEKCQVHVAGVASQTMQASVEQAADYVYNLVKQA
jgi:hypothetical protein